MATEEAVTEVVAMGVAKVAVKVVERAAAKVEEEMGVAEKELQTR